MKRSWLLSEKEFNAVDTYGDHQRICCVQHLKTLKWLEEELHWTSDGGYHGEIWEYDWASILGQARKDVKGDAP